ncbi:DUF6491 family protein [Parendozoicomonas haliclonae]|uniref:Lipoprotein n=1 Tax=Parendozoicomonas haliclonae TaxID=1960125 RepID=A0A1X7AJ23_9GAMM|nr:DUF6491 family protein [Parendozoicomonas haliclonae]SMA44282.1 hypothetical protein EHSB41UT_01769 [Parendozoicomonas haliclonae]
MGEFLARLIKPVLLVLISGIVLVGCASVQESSSADRHKIYQTFIADQQLAPVEKITSFRFSGWKSLDDKYLIITSNYKKDYLVELNSSCVGLRHATTIKVNRFSDMSLSRLGDTISVIGGSAFPCHIKGIYPLTREQSRDLWDTVKGSGEVVIEKSVEAGKG